MCDLHDTIVALATPRGGAWRGIVRVSGARAWDAVGCCFRPQLPSAQAASRPQACQGQLCLPPLPPVPATLFLSRAPRSYTGQDLVEIHTLGSPPILELALSTLLAAGCRQAIAGEFTMRAFLSGKLDLTAAEAVLALIDATTPQQAAVALDQMAGGIAHTIMGLRTRLLDLLAELEAGLDFVEEDIEFVDRTELLGSLAAARRELTRLADEMQTRTVATDRRRVVLVGPPNVGKSTLFNALVGRSAAITSDLAGTTRDYLCGTLPLTDCTVELVDTAGADRPADAIGEAAQNAREVVAGSADLLLWCIDARDAGPPSGWPVDQPALDSRVLIVRTKCDLAPGESSAPTHHSRPITKPPVPRATLPVVWVSALSGAGLPSLRAAIEGWVRGGDAGESSIVASTAARCRQAIAGALAAIQRALGAAGSRASEEFVALELRLALDELAHVVGAVYTDDILDRIFSRFCIGK